MDNLLVRLYVTCIAKMLLIIGCKGSDFPIFFRNFTPRFNMFCDMKNFLSTLHQLK